MQNLRKYIDPLQAYRQELKICTGKLISFLSSSRQVSSMPSAMLSQLFTYGTACTASQITIPTSLEIEGKTNEVVHDARHHLRLCRSIPSNNRQLIRLLMNLEQNQVLFFRFALQHLTTSCPCHLCRSISVFSFSSVERKNHSIVFPYCVVYLPSSIG